MDAETAVQSPAEKKDVTWTRPKALTSVSPHMLGRVSEVMLLDSQCGVLVHKRTLQDIPYRKAQQVFTKHMKTVGQKYLSPYFRDDDIDFFYLSKNDIFLVAATPSVESDTAISIVIYLDLLQRLYELLKDCIGTVNEPYITVNRMLVFEVLDEVMNRGYCFISSYTEIKSYLSFEPIRPKIPQQDDLASRFFGINIADKSRTQGGVSEPKSKVPNSVYINIVEGLSAVIGVNGEVFSSELWGKLSLISTLERPAPVNIQLNPDLVIRASGEPEGQVAGATHIENPSFHSCVDASQLARKKVLRVLPPSDQVMAKLKLGLYEMHHDGLVHKTRLMIYTLSDSSCISIPIVVIPALQPIESSRDQNFILRLINQADSFATASYVRMRIKFPQSVTSVSTTKSGERQTSHFDSVEKVAEWEIKRMKGGSEEFITFRLISQTDKAINLADIGPISLTFSMAHFSASGLRVRMATVDSQMSSEATGLAPECFFGFSTKAASYTVRTTDAGQPPS